MNDSWKFFLFLVLISLIIQGFFSMLEMASVSFNRVRLQYYVSKNNKRAKWLSILLKNPGHLFGTTLIGVNAAMQFGSECARRFYASLELSPDWAPLTQIFIVLIFAELSPMFAARRYPEHVTMLGIPIIYFTSLILRPVTTAFNWACQGINVLFGGIGVSHPFITREELQRAIEERDEMPGLEEPKEFDPVLMNIFSLKTKTAKDLMEPINRVKMISSEATIGELKKTLEMKTLPFIPVFHKHESNIVAVAYPRDLLRYPEDTRLRAHARPPWFITEKNSALEIIKEFRKNNQSLAVVLSPAGVATGILTLDGVVDEIFGRRDNWVSFGEFAPEKRRIFIDRIFSGDTKVSDINLWFKLSLPMKEEDETLEDLMQYFLAQRPERGDSVRVGDFEVSVEESSLIGGKTISIRSI